MKALETIGLKKALRFFTGECIRFVLGILIYPPARCSFLRLCGAKIGKGVILHRFEFINYYRGSFTNLVIGDECYIGSGVLFDLADTVTLESQVTLSDRVTLMTHLNVGYADHPLQAHYPPQHKGIMIRTGCFVGVNATILHGVEIKPLSLVGAGAVVNQSLPGNAVYAGVPAKRVRTIIPG